MSKMITMVLLMGLVGCGGINYSVPVAATPDERGSLAGTWEGTYEITDNGARKGHLYFDLSADADTAIGYVVMSAMRYLPRNNVPGNVYPAAASEQIPIRFISAMDGYIRGELDVYRDPECGCRLNTVFIGQRKGDRFYGTFTSRHSDTNTVAAGKWEAVRTRR